MPFTSLFLILIGLTYLDCNCLKTGILCFLYLRSIHSTVQIQGLAAEPTNKGNSFLEVETWQAHMTNARTKYKWQDMLPPFLVLLLTVQLLFRNGTVRNGTSKLPKLCWISFILGSWGANPPIGVHFFSIHRVNKKFNLFKMSKSLYCFNV